MVLIMLVFLDYFAKKKKRVCNIHDYMCANSKKKIQISKYKMR